MNRFSGIGRLTKDPETCSFDNGNKTAFTIAIDRRFTNKDGNKEADFLPCVAWKGTADFIARYFHKGMKIAVSGSVQVRSYTAQDGSKRSITEIVVDEAEFVERKEGGAGNTAPATNDTNEPVEYLDDSLPF